MEIKPSFFFFKQTKPYPSQWISEEKLVYERLSSQKKRLKFHITHRMHRTAGGLSNDREEGLYKLVQRPFLSIVNNASHGITHEISTTT